MTRLKQKFGKQKTEDLEPIQAWSNMVRGFNADVYEERQVGYEATHRTTCAKPAIPVPSLFHHPAAWSSNRHSASHASDPATVHPAAGAWWQPVKVQNLSKCIMLAAAMPVRISESRSQKNKGGAEAKAATCGKKRSREEMLDVHVPGCLVEDDEVAQEIRTIAPKLRALAELNEKTAAQLRGNVSCPMPPGLPLPHLLLFVDWRLLVQAWRSWRCRCSQFRPSSARTRSA